MLMTYYKKIKYFSRTTFSVVLSRESFTNTIKNYIEFFFLLLKQNKH